MIDEAKSRHFNTDDTDSFFGFKSPTIYHNNSLKTNNAFIRAFKAAKKLGVSITEDQDNNSSLESHVSSHPTSFSLEMTMIPLIVFLLTQKTFSKRCINS